MKLAPRLVRKKLLLPFLSVAVFFFGMELPYRLFDPFIHIPRSEINRTEYGNLSQYDELLGWKGVPNLEGLHVTENRKVPIRHNSRGFRDIEHPPHPDRSAVVFLGDSFTWGYETEYEEMFVNRLRKSFPEYEGYNLSHRGYGTDQSLLIFQEWKISSPVALVVLVFCENDFENNRKSVQYKKFKPKFEIRDEALVLTNVPVPKDARWKAGIQLKKAEEFRGEWLKELVLKSHFINDMIFRIKLIAGIQPGVYDPGSSPEEELTERDYRLTRKIIERLKQEVARRGSKLVVIAAPSKREFVNTADYHPYQKKLRAICNSLGIPYYDLAPAFRKAVLRTYYRLGPHWNAHGHEIAARAMEDYFKRNLGLFPGRAKKTKFVGAGLRACPLLVENRQASDARRHESN